MNIQFAVRLVGTLCCAAAACARAEVRVWTETATRHVVRSEAPGGGLAVQLGAARHEWVSFQILVRADRPIQIERVVAGDLRGPGTALIPAGEARLYRQHQLYLDAGTYRNAAFKPDWYPDPLIPFDPPPPGTPCAGARFSAVPFDLPPNETHGFWVDLYVPSNTAAGTYQGTYRLTGDQGLNIEIPVVLTVWDFALPPTPTLVTEFGSPSARLRAYYRQQKWPQPPDWTAVETQIAQLLCEHRCNAVPPAELLRPVAQPAGTFRVPPEQVQALRRFVDQYHVNALQVPHPSSVVSDPEAQGEKLRAWLAAFDRLAAELARPQIVFFTYLKDEPNTLEDYRYVQQWGRAVRAARSVVKVLVVEQPWTAPGLGGADSAWGDLYGAVDIWCPLFSLHRSESAAPRLALGESIWTYTALCQGRPTPWWHIDFPLLNYRVPAWIAWRNHMTGLLYWGGMAYWQKTDDPWQHAPFYVGNGKPQQGRQGIRFNGEGSLVYPARAVGYDGVVPTIRLKALRSAIQDYEYLAILARRGRADAAEQVARPLAGSFFEWDQNPAAFEAARARLAALITAGTRHTGN